MTWKCFGCGKDVDGDDAVWVNPNTLEATTGPKGCPYHVECAPSEYVDDKKLLVNILK